jgi:hypothetical protein
VDDRVAGVAYCRLFSDGDHGHGYVDDCKPEVAVAACRNHRGRGLGEASNLDWLRKQAKRHLEELRRTSPDARLADAQFDLAKRYGCSSWRARSGGPWTP